MSQKKTTSELVADIRTRYRRANADKLAIQKDMVALRDQHGWTQQQIADKTGVPRPTVKDWLLAWDEQVDAGLGEVTKLTPQAHHRASDRAVAKRVLATGSMEEIEHVLEQLPVERRKQIAASAGHAYLARRVAHDEHERNLTPAQRSERDAAAEAMTLPVRKAAAGFAALGIVGHLEQALDDLHELVADGSLSTKLVRQIDRALENFEAELQVARGLVGIDRS